MVRVRPSTGPDSRVDQPYDEFYDADGCVRPVYEQLARTVASLGADELAVRTIERDMAHADRGVTYDHQGVEAVFPFDPIPRILTESAWRHIAAGVRQRVRALEAFLDDVYGAQQILADGVIPRALVLRSTHFRREVHGLRPANGVRVHVSGVDLVRDADGTFLVLEDNLRVPSGVSYALDNRRTTTTRFPELLRGYHVESIDTYPSQLLAALRASAPDGVNDPTVVLLTPGPYNAAYFEHAYLARRMGIPLVQPSDLICSGGRCYLRSTRRSNEVHVIYRRIDDAYLDPVAFDPTSLLGVAGLIVAAREGTVTIANAVGNGVADDKLIGTWVPTMIDYYLGEQPLLGMVPTYRLNDPDEVAWVIANLDRLVVKPTDGAGGKGVVVGTTATDEELTNLAGELRAHPYRFIAQPIIPLSTHHTLDGRALHVDLRPFAINHGDHIWVMPGGLTRTGPAPGVLVVNSSQGGGSKDTWVLRPGNGRVRTSRSVIGLVDQVRADIDTPNPEATQ
ncbi:protein of unknown function DUF404 [Acidimicrobium ferrooxidans DSM 10331]|uniref:Circularly permuted ATP-grasp type 2 domain-containing protein n=1 Tax=Acidimicrobium ferrooxidans (strain DSM 10331 / JCM 15462 / NBRC 103882 / ICP) TaxID=525909 RepID=C7M0S6_ACIFD|nr:circularly permuted type 2 ATP-grasp protein [Acidimicrobium ferrooxidans]ACU54584.1 protein of unknown function DUF404 [Acidimicrobium ferrooxidans DSM 10331]